MAYGNEENAFLLSSHWIEVELRVLLTAEIAFFVAQIKRPSLR